MEEWRTPETLLARTRAVDQVVTSRWPDIPGVAMIAVGGYGREELFPCSDVDLMFVSRRDDLQPHLAPFLRGLWDAGLRESHSVHTPEECITLDERNAELSVSMLDRRFLAGDQTLFSKLRDPAKDQLAPALARLTRARHAKYGDTIYHLEPNIKDAPGTLRDLQVLRWLAKLDGSAALIASPELLVALRILLHQLSGRDQNVLKYEMQDRCTSKLGFTDPSALMRGYYREAASLHRACLRRLDQVERRKSSLLAALRDRAARLSNSDFSVIHGDLYFRAAPVNAPLVVRLFEFVARHGLPLAPDTEERVRHCAEAAISWAELRNIFSLPSAALAVRAMQETGYFAKLFPQLHAIESLVVRDFYHRYTVDEHTMVAMEAALSLREVKDVFGEVSRETPDYPLLLLALLFHDAGKGLSNANHAEASVSVAADACKVIQVSARETEIVLYLIAAHLEMSRLMLTRDLSDPGTAALLGKSVKTLERLKLLTLLTRCDISAVNPEAFTQWRASLLWRLYVVTQRHLTTALQTEIAEEGMPARYGLTHSREEIAEHRRMEQDGCLTTLEKVEGAYRLTVVAPDQPALFARIAGALAGFGMNILRAESFTNERRIAVETFCFADQMRTLELNPTEIDRLQRAVEDALLGKRKVEDLVRARPPKSNATNGLPVLVAFDNTASPRATLFELTAQDRPGLLFDLTRSIADAGGNIEVVLVDTEGHKAIDVFYVTQDGQPLTPSNAELLCERLRTAAA